MPITTLEKDGTITVKAKNQQIVFQINTETTPAPGSREGDLREVEAGNVTQVLLSKGNFTDAEPSRDSRDKSATTIMVQSGQSIVIQVREGSEEVKLPFRAVLSEKDSSQNATSAVPLPATPPEAEAVKAVQELPEPAMLPKDEGVVEGVKGVSPALAQEKSSIPVEESTSTKGFSAYANLALRTR